MSEAGNYALRCKPVSDAEKEYIFKNFRYCDGKIIRFDREGGNGSVDRYGYLILKIRGKQYKAHHIAWLLVYGEFPSFEIDHINRNKLDNRICNLRISNRRQQTRNVKRGVNPDTGVVGVYLDRTSGLKKRYAFHHAGKTYRCYTVREALEKKHELQKTEC